MDREALATEVRRRRAAAGLSLRELGRIASVDYSLIAQIEKGRKNVTIDVVDRLLGALDPAPPDPHAALVARFIALVPRLTDGERLALISMIDLLEQHHLA
jgi:transcriptional regulator with XRE-family HTH domain